jgi:coenzyme F420-reducing hydrogenase beta subunit/polysaccharide pyruvyl transferase WcaK-like protein
MAKTSWNDLTAARYLGQYKASYFGYSLLENFRENAASGGITSTILIDALRQKKIDGALLHHATLVDGEPKSEFIIARTEEEIYQSQGSAYLATLFSFKALPMIREFKGKLAVVCLPCDAIILRRMRESEPEIKEKITLVITLFCGHNSEKELTDLVIRKLNPEKKAVKSFRYRFGHWRGNLKLEFNDGESVIKPFSFFSDYQNLYFYSQKKCLLCGDQTGFDSDISIGDIWSMKMKSNPIKHNAILVRTERGAQALQGLVDRDLAHIFQVPISELCAGQSRSLPLHASVNARVWAAKRYGMNFKPVSDEKPTFLEKTIARVVLFNYWLSHDEKRSGIIPKLPRFVIKLYLYAFKGLQVFQKPKRITHSIGIIGGSIWGNRGAESMLVTTIGKLKERYPEADFKVFSIYPKKDRELITDPRIQVLSSKPLSLLLLFLPFSILAWLLKKIGINVWLPASVRRLRECAVLYDIGGITFAERGMVLFYNVLTLWPAILLGIPVVKLSQAVGPFNSPVNRQLARIFISRCQKVYPRGEFSAKYLAELEHKPEPSKVSTDIAFLYRPEYSLSCENPDKVEKLVDRLSTLQSQDKKIIIFSPSTVVLKKMSSPRYEQLIVNVIRKIDQSDYYYLFLPNSNRAGSENLQNNDIQVNERIRRFTEKQIPESLRYRMEWIDWDINTKGIQEIMREADLVVTSRFHSMISALSLSIPIYVIGWGHKYLEILQLFQMEDFICDYSKAEPDRICDALTQLLENKNSVQKQINRNLPAVKESSNLQFLEIDVKFNDKK